MATNLSFSIVIGDGEFDGLLVEDVTPRGSSILAVDGVFQFTDAARAPTTTVSVGPAAVEVSDPRLGTAALGAFSAVVSNDARDGNGRVDWAFAVDNALVQGLGRGDTVTQTYTVTFSGGVGFAVDDTEGSAAQQDQRMVALQGGRFVVVWTEASADSGVTGVYARVFGADGLPIDDARQVNTTVPTLGAQAPSVAALEDGGFVVVWRSDGDGGGLPGESALVSFGVSGQVFTSAGARVGSEFQANVTSQIGDQDDPEVVALDNGEFAVTWRGQEQRTDPQSGGGDATYTVSILQGQVFRVAGAAGAEPVGREFRSTPTDPPGIETLLPGVEAALTISLADGGFVQAWTWSQPDEGVVAVLFRAYDDDGAAVGDAVTANAEAGGRIASASLGTPLGAAALADGGFVLGWQTGSSGVPGLAFRLFDADGDADGGTTLVGSGADGIFAADLRIAGLADGGFVAVWSDLGAFCVRGQVFDDAGDRMGDIFSVVGSGREEAVQSSPIVVARPNGSFTVLCSENDGLITNIIAMEFSAGGAPGASFIVNLEAGGTQDLATATVLPSGAIAATWLSQAGFGASAVVGRVLEAGASGATAEITVTIEGVNDTPFATAKTANFVRVLETGVGVASTAAIVGSIADVIGDADTGEAAELRVVAAGRDAAGPAPLNFAGPQGEAAVAGTFGTLFLTAAGDYRYVLDNADADTQALRQGQLVSEVFGYVVANNGGGGGNEAGATITVNLRGTNDAPTAAAETASVAVPGRDDPMSVGRASGTLGDNIGDVDAGEAAALRFTRAAAGTAPTTALGFDAPGGEASVVGTYGTLFLTAQGAWRYELDADDPDTARLAAGDAATETFRYTVANNGGGVGNEATSTLAITIGRTASELSLVASALAQPLATSAVEIVIGTGDLAASGAAAGALTYTVTTAGAGTLVLDGITLAVEDTFTQADVDAGRVVYRPGPIAAPAPGTGFADVIGLELSNGAGDVVDATLVLAYAPYDTVQTAPGRNLKYSGGDGDDFQMGTDADESLAGRGGDDQLSGAGGADSLKGAGGTDRLFGQLDDDDLNGGAGDDLIRGGAGDDSLKGGDDADLLIGGSGDDTLRGGNGTDHVEGGDGNDSLWGGMQADTFLGGAGGDTFVLFAPTDGDDRIIDFVAGEDLIGISAAGFGAGLAPGMDLAAEGRFESNASGVSTATAGLGALVFQTGAGVLWWDADGGGGGAAVRLAVLDGVGALAAADVVVIA